MYPCYLAKDHRRYNDLQIKTKEIAWSYVGDDQSDDGDDNEGGAGSDDSKGNLENQGQLSLSDSQNLSQLMASLNPDLLKVLSGK